MSFASSVALTVACCRAGIIGGWQGGTFTSLNAFEDYLHALRKIEGGAPPIVNLPARIASEPAGEAKLALLEQHRAPLVLSSVGDPAALVDRVHRWGGLVIHDVTTIRHAHKAIDAGADGLMLTCAGAGGHTGFITPFAFVPAVRRIFDGPLIVAGGIADGAGIAGALALGADIACMGTRFIATPESSVVEGHRAMIAEAEIEDILVSAAMNGVPAHWMRQSVEAVGLDPATLPSTRTAMPPGIKPWRDIWSAGHSVGLIDQVEPVYGLVARIEVEFAVAQGASSWRSRLNEISQLPRHR